MCVCVEIHLILLYCASTVVLKQPRINSVIKSFSSAYEVKQHVFCDPALLRTGLGLQMKL